MLPQLPTMTWLLNETNLPSILHKALARGCARHLTAHTPQSSYLLLPSVTDDGPQIRGYGGIRNGPVTPLSYSCLLSLVV